MTQSHESSISAIFLSGNRLVPRTNKERFEQLLCYPLPLYPASIEISLSGAFERGSRCSDLSVRFASGKLSSSAHTTGFADMGI